MRVITPTAVLYDEYVGIGNGTNLISSSRYINCDIGGTWYLNLYNSSGSELINEVTTSFYVTSSQNQNVLNLLSSDSFCAGSIVYFGGYYNGDVGSIEIHLSAEYEYSIGLTEGTFTKSLNTPNDGYGDWFAQLADSNGELIAGTRVDFTTIDCTDDGDGGGDEDESDDANEWADDIISDEFNPYIGAIITGVFLCIPFGLSAQTGMEFPTFGYGFFAVLGLSVSTALGFFPMWIVYVLLVVFIGKYFVLHYFL